jgi:SNF2 family DNA or RNA helicase
LAPFEYRHAPLPHQREVLKISHHLTGFALFMDPGTGKTYVVINNTVYLYEHGVIDALFILAPMDVDMNWVEEELPKHMPARTPWRAVTWRTGKMTRQVKGETVWKDAPEELLTFNGLAILAMNFHAVLSKDGERYAREFLRKRRCLLATDEADEYMAEPKTKRYQRIIALSRWAKVRRVLTGTPVEERPEHAYGIMKAVRENFWSRGTPPLPTYKAFKEHIQIVETIQIDEERTFPKVVGYKNLDWLSERIAAESYRFRKEELGLIPKRHVKHFVGMSVEQQRMYNEMREEFLATFADGRTISAHIKLTQMLRLQQIACGFVPSDPAPLTVPEDWADEEEVEATLAALEDRDDEPIRIEGATSRLDAVEELGRTVEGKTIIWTRFTPDVDEILRRLGPAAARYDGRISSRERFENKRRYLEDRDTRWLVGNPRTGGRGVTVINTRHMIYVSNYFSARTRKQSEDRAHRIGLDHELLITDLVALNTVDTYIIDRLRAKHGLARRVMRDPITDWI